MFLIYLATVGIGLLAAALFYLLSKSKATAVMGGMVVLVFAVAIAQEYISPGYRLENLELSIKKQDNFLNLVAEREPEEFKNYVAKVRNNIVTKGSPKNEIYYTSELINGLLIKYGPKASNDSLNDFLEANIAVDQALIKIDPTLVLTMEFPAKFQGKTDPSMVGITSETKRLLHAKIAVIVSAMQDPQPDVTEEDVKRAATMVNDIIEELAKQYTAPTIIATLQSPDAPDLDKKTAAEIILSLYENIKSKGKSDAALIIKTMFLRNYAKKQ
jgi:hypothetical protein